MEAKRKEINKILLDSYPSFLKALKDTYPLAFLGSFSIVIATFLQDRPSAQGYAITAGAIFLLAFIVSLIVKIFPHYLMAVLMSYALFVVGIVLLFVVTYELSLASTVTPVALDSSIRLVAIFWLLVLCVKWKCFVHKEWFRKLQNESKHPDELVMALYVGNLGFLSITIYLIAQVYSVVSKTVIPVILQDLGGFGFILIAISILAICIIASMKRLSHGFAFVKKLLFPQCPVTRTASKKKVLEISKKLLSGISPPVGFMLANLILDPEISLNPYFLTLLIGGVATFVISLGRFVEKKHSWRKGVWHVAGICLAGFVLVSWARYSSVLTSIMAEILIIAVVGIVFLLTRKALTAKYGKYRRLAYVGLVLGALLPVAPILQHLAETPVLVVSPSPKFVQLPQAGMGQNINVSVASVYASAWDIRLTAESSDLLAVYIDSREKGPIEIPPLERGRELPYVLRVETSPRISNGTYNVTLNFQYKDAIGKTYADSTNVEVSVGIVPRPPAGCLIATATYGSELSPEVRFLREFRDREVVRTLAGREFMTIFNAWYYSFSPGIAKTIAEYPFIQTIVRILLYPLIGILHLSAATYSALNFNPELAVVVAGLLASSFIGAVYFSLFVILVVGLSQRKRRLALSPELFKILGGLWLASLALIAIGETLVVAIAVMVGAGIFVLASLGISAAGAGAVVLRALRK